MPLHIDTGFFVTPATVVRKRWDYRRGWGAWAAGCSKVIPEAFYSAVYLVKPSAYKWASRLAYSGLIFVAGLGLASFVQASGGALIVALAVWCALISEPHWGGYYESAEQFTPALVGGSLGLAGLAASAAGDPLAGWLVAGSVALLALSAGFNKPTDTPLVALGVLSELILFPWAWLYVVLGITLPAMLYVLWVVWNRKTLKGLAETMRAQQKALAGGKSLRGVLEDKADLLWQIVRRWPIVPVLALGGIFVAGRFAILPAALFVGALAAYLMQPNRVWYFTLPMLMPVAYFAALLPLGNVWWIVLALYAAWWLAHCPREQDARYRWVWEIHREGNQFETNLQLDHWADTFRPDIAGKSLFVFGHENQANVLLGAGYDTPLISAAWFLDVMRPAWREELAEQMKVSPPDFLLDMAGRLDYITLSIATRTRYRPKLSVIGKRTLYEQTYKRPKVTAIVSAYFCEEWLEGRLQNLEGQSLRPEILVVCMAGSKEHKIALAHPCRVLATGGVPSIYAAWNIAIEQASGEFLTNANADDRLAPEALERMAYTLQDNPSAALVYADVDVVSTVKGGFEWAPRTGKFRWAEGGLDELLKHCFIGPMPMWRRSLHDAYGMFDDRMRSAGDYEFWLRLAAAGQRFLHVRRVLGIYLDRADSAEKRDKSLSAREAEEARRRYAVGA